MTDQDFCIMCGKPTSNYVMLGILADRDPVCIDCEPSVLRYDEFDDDGDDFEENDDPYGIHGIDDDDSLGPRYGSMIQD